MPSCLTASTGRSPVLNAKLFTTYTPLSVPNTPSNFLPRVTSW